MSVVLIATFTGVITQEQPAKDRISKWVGVRDSQHGMAAHSPYQIAVADKARHRLRTRKLPPPSKISTVAYARRLKHPSSTDKVRLGAGSSR